MSSVAWLRELWRRRILVVLAAVLAIAVGVLLAVGLGHTHRVGVATTSALLDTPSSQVVDVSGRAAQAGSTLPGRAALLASLLAAAPLKDEIARNAGIDPRTLIATAPPAGTDTMPKSTPAVADRATISASDPRASSLTITTDPTLPLIGVRAESPDPAVAGRLADGTIAALKGYLTTQAQTGRVPVGRQLLVKQLGPATAGAVQRGSGPLLAVAAAVVLFGFACLLIVLSSAVAREWRRAAALEDPAADVRARLDVVPGPEGPTGAAAGQDVPGARLGGIGG